MYKLPKALSCTFYSCDVDGQSYKALQLGFDLALSFQDRERTGLPPSGSRKAAGRHFCSLSVYHHTFKTVLLSTLVSRYTSFNPKCGISSRQQQHR